MKGLDKAFFQYAAKKLEGKTPEEVLQYYVENLVFRNYGYLEYLQKEYRLPDDILKLHAKVVKLSLA